MNKDRIAGAAKTTAGRMKDVAGKMTGDQKLRAEGKMEKAASSDMQKVGDFYASGMNETAIDAAKATPLAEEFKHIDAMKDRKDVLKEIGHFLDLGFALPIGEQRPCTNHVPL